MNDTISRQDAIDSPVKMVSEGLEWIPVYHIKELPSAEPERKTAEWIYGENGGQDGWYCSKCGLFIPWDYEYYGLDNIDFIADFHTCPKCDRKMLKYTGMRGEQDEQVDI